MSMRKFYPPWSLMLILLIRFGALILFLCVWMVKNSKIRKKLSRFFS